MQRISVDLPEPDGPQTTIFSPLATLRLMFFSTWNSPYHLSRPSMAMAGMLPIVSPRRSRSAQRPALVLGSGGRDGRFRCASCHSCRYRAWPLARSLSSHWLYFDMAKQKIQ